MKLIKFIPKETKVIAFDLGGVLFKNDPEGITYRSIAKQYKLNYEDVNKLLARNYEIFHQGKISEKDFWAPLINKYHVSLEQCKKFYRSSVAINLPMFDFLKAVYKKYDCYTLNDEPREWMIYRVKKYHLKQYFKGFITSSFYGYTKPDKNLYKIFIRKVKVKPSEIFFIEDSKECILTAKKMGMRTFHYR
ncbi:MAG TPA: HAD-IA family hydrolase [Candidatus Bathyarchaeia archaeon]|nr:HAD-IA family hydrolase [Candidatus Bathyarchaeia archaeon]